MAEDPILAPLNEVQRRIVTWFEGPMLVLAGAGSGKTRAVTHKIAWLLRERKLLPGRILAVTFTNKAAGEMAERVRRLVGPAAAGLEMGTFHSVCARLLRRHAERIGFTPRFTIHDSDDSVVLMRQVVKEADLDVQEYSPRQLAGAWDSLRTCDRDPAVWAAVAGQSGRWRQQACALFERYEQRKVELNAMDFTDLLHRMRDLLSDHADIREHYQQRLDYLVVDEMQDTNRVQLDLLKLLLGPQRLICAVGDDDQSIYGWRGARVENMTRFDQSFPGAAIMRMEQNYRSTVTILNAAHSVISHNTNRHPKKLWTENEEGELLTITVADSESDEAVRIARRISELLAGGEVTGRDLALFVRTNAQTRSFEEIFSREGIPFVVVGGMRFYERAEVKDGLAFLRAIANPHDEISLLRIINRPPRGIGDVAVERLRQVAMAAGESLWAAAERLRKGPEPERWHKSLDLFFAQLAHWREEAARLPVDQLLKLVLKESGYLEKLKQVGGVESESRRDNLDELVASIGQQREANPDLSLNDYLEQVALVTDIDSWGEERERVPLMTVHAAKGLEFHTVFITGMEEELFPHRNHVDADELEEERRLFYVALTRARKRIVISHARSRMTFEGWKEKEPSRFLAELDPDCVVREEPRRRLSFRDLVGQAVGRGFGDRWSNQQQEQAQPTGRPKVSRRRPKVRPEPPTPAPAPARPEPAGTRYGGTVTHPVHGKGRFIARSGAQVAILFGENKLLLLPPGELSWE